MIIISDNNKKKIIIITGAAIILFSLYPYKKTYHPFYKIINDPNGPFAIYSQGCIYIGDENYLSSLTNLNEKDILICDQRFNSDPNIEIYNSCLIKDKDVRNEILEVICLYEELYPSNWNRTIESMRLEWYCHNICYELNFMTDHSSEVDLNNKDENKYNNKFVRRLFRL